MRKMLQTVWLSVVLLLVCLSSTGFGTAQDAGGLHLYQGIPMEGTTPDTVSQILLENLNAVFEVSEVVWSGKAYDIKDSGYEWNLQADFDENYIGINRILLNSAQPARMSADEFPARVQSDFLQFLDVEARLTALYGEPDSRYFYTVHDPDGKTRKYMLQGGVWALEPMLNVCEQDHWFWAYSLWGNVLLKAWVDRDNTNTLGQCLSRVMLYYYPDLKTADGILAVAIGVYPPDGRE